MDSLVELCGFHEDELIEHMRRVKLDNVQTRYTSTSCLINCTGDGVRYEDRFIYWRVNGSIIDMVERMNSGTVEAVSVDLGNSKPINRIRAFVADGYLRLIVPCHQQVYSVTLAMSLNNSYLLSIQPSSFLRRLPVQWSTARDVHIGVIDDNTIALLALLPDKVNILQETTTGRVKLYTFPGAYDAVCAVDGMALVFALSSGCGKLECRSLKGELIHSYSQASFATPGDSAVAQRALCACDNSQGCSVQVSIASIDSSSNTSVQTVEFTRSSDRWRAISLRRLYFEDSKSDAWCIRDMKCYPSKGHHRGCTLMILLVDRENGDTVKVLHTNAAGSDILQADLRNDFPSSCKAECFSLQSHRRALDLVERKNMNHSSIRGKPMGHKCSTISSDNGSSTIALRFQRDEWTPLSIILFGTRSFLVLRRGSLSLLCCPDRAAEVQAGYPFQECFPCTLTESGDSSWRLAFGTATCDPNCLEMKLTGRLAVVLLQTYLPNELGKVICSCLNSRCLQSTTNMANIPALKKLLYQPRCKISALTGVLQFPLCDLLPYYFIDHRHSALELVEAMTGSEPILVEMLMTFCSPNQCHKLFALIDHPTSPLIDRMNWDRNTLRYLQCLNVLFLQTEGSVSTAIKILRAKSTHRNAANRARFDSQMIRLIDAACESQIDDAHALILHCVGLLSKESQREINFGAVKRLFASSWHNNIALIDAVKCSILKNSLIRSLCSDICKGERSTMVDVFCTERLQHLPDIAEIFISQYCEMHGDLATLPVEVCRHLVKFEQDAHRTINAIRLYLSVAIAQSQSSVSHTQLSYENQSTLLKEALSIWNPDGEKVITSEAYSTIYAQVGTRYVQVTRKSVADRLAILKAGLLLKDYNMSFQFCGSEQHTLTVDKLLEKNLIQAAIEFAQALDDPEVIQFLMANILKCIILEEGIKDEGEQPLIDGIPIDKELAFLGQLSQEVFTKHELGLSMLSEFLKIQVQVESDSNRMIDQIESNHRLTAPDWLIDLAMSEDPGSTLRLYISCGLVCDAADIAIQYLRQCSESINPVERSGASAYIPVGVLDQLIACLRFNLVTEDANSDTVYLTVFQSLVNALISYAAKVETISNSWDYEMRKKRGRESRGSLTNRQS